MSTATLITCLEGAPARDERSLQLWRQADDRLDAHEAERAAARVRVRSRSRALRGWALTSPAVCPGRRRTGLR